MLGGPFRAHYLQLTLQSGVRFEGSRYGSLVSVLCHPGLGSCVTGEDDLEEPLRAYGAIRLPAPIKFRLRPMSSTRSLRNVETRKKKASRAIPRAKTTRNQGNTAAGRKRLKKEAGLRRGAKAAEA